MQAKSELIEKGIQAGEKDMYDEDTIWSQNSGDKVDIAEELMRIIRKIFRFVPLDRSSSGFS